MSLKDAVKALVARGEHDPHRIAAVLIAETPRVDLANMLLDAAPHLVAEFAREQQRFRRHASVERLMRSVNQELPSKLRAVEADLPFLAASTFVPGRGWKQNGDLTASDADLVSADYRRRVDENAAWADLYDGIAARIRASGARTFGAALAIAA